MFGAGYQYSHKIFSHFEFPQELTVLELDFPCFWLEFEFYLHVLGFAWLLFTK